MPNPSHQGSKKRHGYEARSKESSCRVGHNFLDLRPPELFPGIRPVVGEDVDRPNRDAILGTPFWEQSNPEVQVEKAIAIVNSVLFVLDAKKATNTISIFPAISSRGLGRWSLLLEPRTVLKSLRDLACSRAR